MALLGINPISAGQISSVVACEDIVYVGTSNGYIQGWPLDAEGQAPFAGSAIRIRTGQPVTQLQALPTVGLLIRACGGEVSAHALESLRLVACLHRSRATRFHSDGGTPEAGLCVCAGQSLVWRYSLASPPRLVWSSKLDSPTTAVHLTVEHAALATTTRCCVLCTDSGDVLAECSLPVLARSVGAASPADGGWGASCFVQSSELGVLRLLPLTSNLAPRSALVSATKGLALHAASIRHHPAAPHPSVVVSLSGKHARLQHDLGLLPVRTPPIGADANFLGLLLVYDDGLLLSPPLPASPVHISDPFHSLSSPAALLSAAHASRVYMHGMHVLVVCGAALVRLSLLPDPGQTQAGAEATLLHLQVKGDINPCCSHLMSCSHCLLHPVPKRPSSLLLTVRAARSVPAWPVYCGL